MARQQGLTTPQQKPMETNIGTAINMLQGLLSRIWDDEQIPAEWKDGILIKQRRKGDVRDCSNYRGIALLSVQGKVLNRVLYIVEDERVSGHQVQ